MSRLHRYIPTNAQPSVANAEARDRFVLAIGGKELLDQIVKDGIAAYLDYVDEQISSYVANGDLLLTEIFGSGPLGDRISHLFDALVTVATSLSTLDPRSSLHDIAQDLLAGTRHLRLNELKRIVNDQALHCEHHLVFACIGWLSMLFIPHRELSGSSFRLLEPVITLSPTRNATWHNPDIHRPLGTMLRKMGLLPIPCPAAPPVQRGAVYSGSFMKLSVLCYASLYQIGDISIVWVNNLVDHLHFDPERQELKVFRFPSHCLQAIRGTPDVKVLARILNAHTCNQPSRNCERDIPDAITAYLREILTSYRVIFGQHKKSRELFRSRESSRARYKFVEDPILQSLCGLKRTSLLTQYLTTESEKEVFDAKVDFPHLGTRLLQVHNYNANQKPSAWRALLLDRRDSRETFNFYWTVVVVGGISITLSLIQTVVAIIALATQSK